MRDQRIAAYGQNDSIGPPALGGRANHRNHVFLRSIDGRIEPEAGRYGVPLRVQIRREHLRGRSLGQGGEHDSDRALADHQHRLIRREIQAAHAFEAGIQRLDEDRLGKRDAIGNLHQSAFHDPVHHPHIAGEASAGRLKTRGAADSLVNRTLGKSLLAAVVASAAGYVVEDSHPVARRQTILPRLLPPRSCPRSHGRRCAGAECDPVWIFFRSVPQMPQL